MTIAMQRSMSYRKPVPEYVPSPPSSPLREPGQVLLGDEKHLPPLPPNWREIVGTKVVESTSSAPYLASTVSPQDKKATVEAEEEEAAKHESHFPSVDVGADKESLISARGSHVVHPHVRRGRGLPTRYRPPTPPLRSQSKQRRGIQVSGDKTLEATALYSQTSFSHYPASHASSKLYLLSTRSGPPLSSLHPTPSFRTEMTAVSMTTDVSMGWSRGLGGALERGTYSSPTLFMQKQNARRDASMIGHDASRNHSSSGFVCGRWPNWKFRMSIWTKKIRRAFGAAK